MRYINPKSTVTGRILGLGHSPIITEPLDERQEQVNFKPAVPKILKTQEKLKKLSLESVPQKEKLKNISFDL